MTQALTLGVLLALSAVTIATAAGWAAAAVVHLASPRLRRLPAASRAAILAQAHLLPLLVTLAIVPAQIVAFVTFEAGGPESAGALLIVSALAGAMLVVDAARSATTAWRETRAVVAAWRTSARPLRMPQWAHRAWRIERPFPVVAVVGLARPQLYVASQVVRECTPGELAAIAEHEAAHVRAGDNLLRWLYRVTPGARMAARIAEPLERAWTAAAEEAADAAARRRASALELASALTKVARMAVSAPPAAGLASTLIGGAALTLRVHRLLEPPQPHYPAALGWLPAVGALAAAAALQSPAALATLHQWFEMLVRK